MRPPPAGVRTTSPGAPDATRIVLVRHGEAICNVEGVVGGVVVGGVEVEPPAASVCTVT